MTALLSNLLNTTRSEQPFASEEKPGGLELSMMKDVKSWIKLNRNCGLVVVSVATLAVLLAALCLLAKTRLGSVSAGIAFLRGDRLIVGYLRSFGRQNSGSTETATFRITNWTNETVSLLGFKADCTCVVAQELPIQIPRRESRELAFRVKDGANPNGQPRLIEVYTSCRKKPILVLTGQSKPYAPEKT